MKSSKQIQEYMSEVFDKVWYIRSLTHTPEMLRERGTPENIIQGMLNSRAKVIDKYGVNWYDEVDDWEYGFLSGALATLRWVSDKREDNKRFLDT